MSTNDPDIQVAAARQGDQEGLAALCRAYYPRILDYMRYRVAPAAAEDLAAEVLLKVVRHIGNQTGSFRAWIFKIARNAVIDHVRKRKIRQEESMNERIAGIVEDRPAPDVTVTRRHDLRQAVAQLTDDQRELVVLKFMEGLSNEEIAEVTGRRPGAVRALQFRALSALRDLLGKGAGYE